MDRDIKTVAKEIDCTDLFNKINSYYFRRIDFNVKTWDDFVLKNFPKIDLFDSAFFENKQLTSLNGCPQEINSGFYCSNNKLTSLKGGPQEVNSYYSCDFNKLTSLKGSPEKVNTFMCGFNKLSSLADGPVVCYGTFYCAYNPIKSLENSSLTGTYNFNCSHCKLTSLNGAPSIVENSLDLSHNPKLPEYKIKAYTAYLSLQDDNLRNSLTKDGRYFPTKEWENSFKE